MNQSTIKRKVKSVGIGLHTGEPIEITIEPLEEDGGIVFFRKDLQVTIEAKPQNVVNTQMATVIGKNGASISTIEHLLSAIYAYGIDNIYITIDGPEVPVMDGSAISFCLMLEEAGLQMQTKSKKIMMIKKEVEIRKEGKYVKLSPSKSTLYDFSIYFDHTVIGAQSFTFDFSKKGYVKEIAKARTFGFLKEVQYLRSKNLALGGSLDNAVVLDDYKILNSEGLRYKDEFVRHKILDAMGDLSLIGMQFLGTYRAFAGSHHLNHLLTKELLSSKENYEIKSFDEIKEFSVSKVYS